ncbi:Hypothetical predicted protein [Xyrichtys novacula]|uniref:Uncharacterized protein n=1 Tax=Xyrichtys novacula TaxID=13765 RepID=A0AAV1FER8_XYRNO|nr:Hypothetical predicted protein [Xyrichtys novacula]
MEAAVSGRARVHEGAGSSLQIKQPIGRPPPTLPSPSIGTAGCEARLFLYSLQRFKRGDHGVSFKLFLHNQRDETILQTCLHV